MDESEAKNIGKETAAKVAACRDAAKNIIQFNSAIDALSHFFHSGTDHEFAKTLINLIDKHGADMPYTRETREAMKDGLNNLIAGNMPPMPGWKSWDEYRKMVMDASLDAIQNACDCKNEGPEESGSLYKPPDPRAKKCDYPGCTEWARYYGKQGGVTRYLCVPHFKEVYNVPNW